MKYSMCKNTEDFAKLKSDTKELASKYKEALAILTSFL